MSASFHFGEVSSLAVGTVGPRGRRVFYLQIRDAGSIVSFKCEKQQVEALAEYLAGLLTDLPPVDVRQVPDQQDLAEPVESEWPLGAMGVDFNEQLDHFVLMAEELGNDVDEEGNPIEIEHGTLRLAIDRGQASAFIAQARELVSAGRPPCPYCGRPWEPAENFCPCYN